MTLRTRLARLCHAAPCAACDGAPRGQVIRWLEDDEEPPVEAQDAPAGRCETCGRQRSGGVLYVRWQR